MTTSEFFAPPRAWTRLPVAAERSATIRAVGRLADERDRVDVGVVEDRTDCIARAMHEVDDARRNLVDVCDQLDDALGGARVALGRLQDEGVAAGDGVGQEPQRDHRREVERRDRGADADGLAHELDVHSCRDPFQVLALEQVGDAARGLGRLDSAQHLATRVVERLAHVLGDEPGDLLVVGPERLAHRHHGAGALLRRRRSPSGECFARGADSSVHVGLARERYQRGHLAGGGVHIIEGLASSGLDPATADEVSKRACIRRPFRHASIVTGRHVPERPTTGYGVVLGCLTGSNVLIDPL